MWIAILGVMVRYIYKIYQLNLDSKLKTNAILTLFEDLVKLMICVLLENMTFVSVLIKVKSLLINFYNASPQQNIIMLGKHDFELA
jgi:hypothetical protein